MTKTKQVAKADYNKEYWQRDEVKEKNAARMGDVYSTEEGQTYEHKKRRTPRSRYARGKYGARRRKKEFTLSFEDYSVLISNPCAYCNKSIADETGVGLDRIDNEGGYVFGNVAPCCSSCNRIRSKSMGAEEFKKQTKLNRRRQDG